MKVIQVIITIPIALSMQDLSASFSSDGYSHDPYAPPVASPVPVMPPLVAHPIPLPTEKPRPLQEYVAVLPNSMLIVYTRSLFKPQLKLIVCLFDSSALLQKFQGRQEDIEANTTEMEQQLIQMYKMVRKQAVGTRMRHKALHDDRLRGSLLVFEQIMFSDPQHPPPFAIQSDYIFLWANLNIYYAMNYILSPLCSGFDDFAIVTLLKQLTVRKDARKGTRSFVNVIKEIWNGIFLRAGLKIVVLHFGGRNVASYSLATLAVEHKKENPEILATLIRLLEESIAENHLITLACYNCVIRRLSMIAPQFINGRELDALRTCWKKSKPMLRRTRGTERFQKRLWHDLMMDVLHTFGPRCPPLADDIKAYYGFI